MMTNDTETTHNFKYKKGQRVKLLDSCADVYMRAWGGAEGFVGGRKLDETGYFPLIYIVWDRDHWRHNGEENLWTFESHFEPVEKTMSEKNDDLLTALAQLIENHRDKPDPTPEPEPETVIEDREVELKGKDREHYTEQLRIAARFAQDCEAFMLVAVKRDLADPTDSRSTVLIPEIFAEYQSEEAGLLLETQLSQIAAGAHTDAAGILIQQIFSERDENASRDSR